MLEGNGTNRSLNGGGNFGFDEFLMEYIAWIDCVNAFVIEQNFKKRTFFWFVFLKLTGLRSLASSMTIDESLYQLEFEFVTGFSKRDLYKE